MELCSILTRITKFLSVFKQEDKVCGGHVGVGGGVWGCAGGYWTCKYCKYTNLNKNESGSAPEK